MLVIVVVVLVIVVPWLLWVKGDTRLSRARTEAAYRRGARRPSGRRVVDDQEGAQRVAAEMAALRFRQQYNADAASGRLGFIRPSFYQRWGTRLLLGGLIYGAFDAAHHGSDGGGEFSGAPDELA